MRKKKFYAAGMISLVLIFGTMAMACVSNLGVYNPDVSPDQLSHLKIGLKLGITGINGKPVSWGIARQTKSTNISIPAGEHSLRFEYFHSDEYVQQSASNFIFTYNFLPGHSYTIDAGMLGRTVVVYVRDRTDKKLSTTITMR